MDGKSAGEPAWRVSKLCESGACVAVGALGESILIRNTADPDGLHITLGRRKWRAFVAEVKGGEYDSLRVMRSGATTGEPCDDVVPPSGASCGSGG
jgi:hypothetical protein